MVLAYKEREDTAQTPFFSGMHIMDHFEETVDSPTWKLVWEEEIASLADDHGAISGRRKWLGERH
jgi:hypothetical protein